MKAINYLVMLFVMANAVTGAVYLTSTSWNTDVSNEGLTVTSDGFDELDPETADASPLVRPHFIISRGVGEDTIDVTEGSFSLPQSGSNYLRFSDPSGSAGNGAGVILIEFGLQQKAVSFYLGDLHDSAASSVVTTIEVSADGSDFDEVWKVSGSLGSNNSGSLQEVYSSSSISLGGGVNTFIGLTDFINGIQAIRITNTADGWQEQISMDTVAFTAVPEPSIFTALASLLVLVTALAKRLRWS
jgi:hypothetical protein